MLVAFSIKDDAKKGKSLSLREMHVGELFKNYYYMAYLVFAIALNIPLNCSYTFMPYLIKSVGADPSLYGILTGYKALMEIPMLILMVHLRKRFRMPHIIVAAGIFYVLEMTLYSFAGNFAHLFFIITFQGIGGGLFIGEGYGTDAQRRHEFRRRDCRKSLGRRADRHGRRKGLLFHSRLHDLRSCCPLPSQLPSGPADSQTAPSQCRPPSPRPAL